jgi:endonuclease YncB( thermonuclease family)
MVQLHRVTDGDTLVVRTADGDELVVRLLGIKSFEPAPDKDLVAGIGRAAIVALEKRVGDRPLRILLHSTPKDRYGRTIATLIVGDEDIGLHLIREGLALVYPVYPFQTLPMYLDVQAKARAEGKGLWADATATRRAEALLSEWGKRAAE